MARPNWDSFQWDTGAKVVVSVFLLIVAIVVIGGLSAIFLPEESDQQGNTVSRPRPAPTSRPIVNSTPTLQEYWDLSACLDLGERVVAAADAGVSNLDMALAMERSDGALSRYGALEVVEHCNAVLRRSDSR